MYGAGFRLKGAKSSGAGSSVRGGRGAHPPRGAIDMAVNGVKAHGAHPHVREARPSRSVPGRYIDAPDWYQEDRWTLPTSIRKKYGLWGTHPPRGAIDMAVDGVKAHGAHPHVREARPPPHVHLRRCISPYLHGLRVQGAGCRVQGAGFRVQGAGCRG